MKKLSLPSSPSVGNTTTSIHQPISSLYLKMGKSSGKLLALQGGTAFCALISMIITGILSFYFAVLAITCIIGQFDRSAASGILATLDLENVDMTYLGIETMKAKETVYLLIFTLASSLAFCHTFGMTALGKVLYRAAGEKNENAAAIWCSKASGLWFAGFLYWWSSGFPLNYVFYGLVICDTMISVVSWFMSEVQKEKQKREEEGEEVEREELESGV